MRAVIYGYTYRLSFCGNGAQDLIADIGIIQVEVSEWQVLDQPEYTGIADVPAVRQLNVSQVSTGRHG